MCLWFACLGLHKHDDDDSYPPPTRPGVPPPAAGAATPHHDRPPQAATQRNGYHHGQQGAHYGNGARSASPHLTAAAGAAEAGRKASNDARRGPAVAKDAHERAFAYTGAAETTLKQQPAWNSRVAEVAGHGHGAQRYYYYEPAHKEDAMEYHYSAAAAAADHERY